MENKVKQNEETSEIDLGSVEALKKENQSSSTDGTINKQVVTFNTTVKLHEVQLNMLENGTKTTATTPMSTKKGKPPFFRSTRYFIMVLALISPFVSTYSRTIINFALTDMIDPNFVAQQRSSTDSTSQSQINSSIPVFERDNSCPVDEATRARLLKDTENDISRAQSTSGEKFAWDGFKQGLLKAAFTIGHTPFAIPGSRLSEIYGPQPVMNICAFLMGLACILAPFLAAIHFILLFIDLAIVGLLSSCMTPALVTTFTNWLTPSEKSLMMTFWLITSRLGYAMSSMLCGLLIEAQFSWRYVFFSSGCVAWLFVAVYCVSVRSWPHQHPWISQQELDYLASKNILIRKAIEKDQIEKKRRKQDLELNNVVSIADSSQGTKEEKRSAPWFKLWFTILQSPPVWAFIITKFCVKMTADIVQIELPTYLKRVMHFSPKNNGLVNFLNYVMFCIGCFTVGIAAKYIVKAKPYGLSKTAIRKIFQCVGSFGVSLILLGIALSVCNETATLVLLLSFFLVTTSSVGGEGQMPIDLSERYSGTLHAIASSLSISGAIAPTLVGAYIRNHEADLNRWKYIWVAASIMAALGGLVFMIFGEAKVQPFDTLEDDLEDEKKTRPVEEKVEAGKENEAFENDNHQEKKNHNESIQL